MRWLGVALALGVPYVLWAAERDTQALRASHEAAVACQRAEVASTAALDASAALELRHGPALDYIDAGLPVRCEWEMIPSRIQHDVRDAVAIHCNREAPCRMSWAVLARHLDPVPHDEP